MVHILLAEDNPGDVLLVRKALNMHLGLYDLHVIQDGAEARDFVGVMGKPGQVPCPDLILLDLSLPKVEGVRILRQLRSHPECVHTPVVAMSGYDSPEERAALEELGIACYFRKPSELHAFLQLGAIAHQILEAHAASKSDNA